MKPKPTICMVVDNDVTTRDKMIAAVIMSLAGTLCEVVFAIRDINEPNEDHAAMIRGFCEGLVDANRMPDVSLMPIATASDKKHFVVITPTKDEEEAIHCIGSTAEAIMGLHSAMISTASGTDQSQGVEAVLQERDKLIKRRARRSKVEDDFVVVVCQVKSTFATVAPLVTAMSSNDCRETIIVPVDSEHETVDESWEEVIGNEKVRIESQDWFRNKIKDHQSGLVGVLFYDPWESFRPEWMKPEALATAGVPIFYIHYAISVGVDSECKEYAYNTPTHILASRILTHSQKSVELYGEYCAAGSDHVLNVGSPRLSLFRHSLPKEGKRKKVVWNFHFSVSNGGWSTFASYYDLPSQLACSMPDVDFIVRPHFRIKRDAMLAGGQYQNIWEDFINSVQKYDNLFLDESYSHIAAFIESDVLISDLSSLIPDWIQMRKPMIYTESEHSPGYSSEAAYFGELPTAKTPEEIKNLLVDVLVGGGSVNKKCIEKIFVEEFVDSKESPIEASLQAIEDFLSIQNKN